MRSELSAVSCQPSAIQAKWRGAFVCALALAFSLATAFAADDCSHKVWKWKVDKNAALDLQQSINGGHQPWRVDDVAAVATEAIADRKKDWADDNTVLGVPNPISQTKDTALMIAKSDNGHVRYEVTLRKYAWLLHSAHDDWNWVIWLPASVERIECSAQPH